jgi:dipeptidyl aminopeptidase/acylaminoacyl peptidase
MRRAQPSLVVFVVATVLSASLATETAGARQANLRPLSAEDFYRVRSVGAPRISPDGRWVAFTTALPVETTNGNLTDTWVVPFDRAAPPARVQLEGQSVTGPRWDESSQLMVTMKGETWRVDPARLEAPAVRVPVAPPDGGLKSPDGQWVARVQSMPATPVAEPALSDFERRHETRFKGDAFDWYPFRQDGQRFPLPDRRSRCTRPCRAMPRVTVSARSTRVVPRE